MANDMERYAQFLETKKNLEESEAHFLAYVKEEYGLVPPNPFDQVLTYPDLAQWCAVNLVGASVHLLDGEVIIHTGLTVEMNGELLPIEDVPSDL